MSAPSLVPFRSPAPQTKVCVHAGCWAKGAPQPLEDFYPLRKGSPQRQARCKRCDNTGRLARTRAELSSLGVSPRAAANASPPAPPVEDEQAEVEEPEDLKPETIVDRAWRVYEREERDRSGCAPPRGGKPPSIDLDEAERFANEVFMRVDDAGRWSVVNASPARGGAAHRNGAPELVEVEPRSIAAAKAAARSRPAPASTSLAGFVPPPHVAEHDQFGRDLLVLRERVIARAIARVAKIDEMLAMGFSE